MERSDNSLKISGPQLKWFGSEDILTIWRKRMSHLINELISNKNKGEREMLVIQGTNKTKMAVPNWFESKKSLVTIKDDYGLC